MTGVSPEPASWAWLPGSQSLVPYVLFSSLFPGLHSLSLHFESGVFREYLLCLMTQPTHPALVFLLILVGGLQDIHPDPSLPSCLRRT